MDQRCAVHRKSGDLNNSATLCVTWSVVQPSLKQGTYGEADAPLTENAKLTGEVPEERSADASEGGMDRMRLNPPEATREYFSMCVCECRCEQLDTVHQMLQG